MSFIVRLLNVFSLSKSVYVSTRNDLDAKFRMTDDADRDKLITDDLVKVGHIIYHETDNKHYKLKTYPTYGSLVGVEWEEVIIDSKKIFRQIGDFNSVGNIANFALEATGAGNILMMPHDIQTGRLDITGNYNARFGMHALFALFTGDHNTAIGRAALYSTSSGSHNIAIGYNALEKIVSTEHNIAFGYKAGAKLNSGLDNVNSSLSIFIGRDTKSLEDVTDNEIVIGHYALGFGSNTVVIGNDSITDTYLKGIIHGNGSQLTNINASTLLGLTPAEIIDLLTGAEIALKLFEESNINPFTDSEKSKLAAVESSKWLGEYTSLTALNTAHPAPNPAGSYANVDGGVGADVKRYLWDATDNVFVIQEGTASNITDAQIKSQYEDNADTNAFTDIEKSKLASITAIFTTALKTAYDSASTWITTNGTNLLNHLSNTSNPHSVNKTEVGLSNVPNLDTTDAVNNEHIHSNKLILDSITAVFTTSLKTSYDNVVTWIGTNGTNLLNHLINTSNPHSVDKTDVGLGNVPNIDYTADILNRAMLGYTEIVNLTASDTIVSTHKGKLLSMNNASAMTLTVNTGSLTLVGDFCYLDQEGVGEITVTGGAGVTLKKNSSRDLITDGQYSRVCIQKVTTDSYRVFGELKQTVVLP